MIINATIRMYKNDHIRMYSSGISEFEDVAATLENWEEEILASFVWIGNRRVTNGPIEGKNNYVKKILNNANGMQNFARARNRIMYSQNRYEKPTMNKKDPNNVRKHRKYKKK